MPSTRCFPMRRVSSTCPGCSRSTNNILCLLKVPIFSLPIWNRTQLTSYAPHRVIWPATATTRASRSVAPSRWSRVSPPEPTLCLHYVSLSVQRCCYSCCCVATELAECGCESLGGVCVCVCVLYVYGCLCALLSFKSVYDLQNKPYPGSGFAPKLSTACSSESPKELV